mmetsp:Transcript_3468/g.9287  ORF Transcript_3468/g.9287 Transcript_3468/m.9287 type:complete len:284 (-) Transcript_3468:349-1200(-)
MAGTGPATRRHSHSHTRPLGLAPLLHLSISSSSRDPYDPQPSLLFDNAQHQQKPPDYITPSPRRNDLCNGHLFPLSPVILCGRLSHVSHLTESAISRPFCTCCEPVLLRIARADDHGRARRVLAVRIHSVLASDTGGTKATPGRIWRVAVVGIRPDDTGVQPFHHAVRALEVGSPHAGAQRIRIIVRQAEGLCLGVEGLQRDHWTKDLLLHAAHVGCHAAKDSRLKEIPIGQCTTLGVRTAAASERDSALGIPFCQLRLDLGKGGSRCEGADLRRGLKGRAQA